MTSGTDPRIRILDMLAEGRITVDDAKSLLALVGDAAGAEVGGDRVRERERAGRRDHRQRERERDRRRAGRRGPGASYLRLRVDPRVESGADPNAERVNLRIPMGLIKAGARLTSLVPDEAAEIINQTLSERGIDLDFKSLDAERLDEVLGEGGFMIDVAQGEYRVRISVE